jgi:hypothetical protein
VRFKYRPLSKHWCGKRRGIVIVGICRFAFRPDWAVTRESEESNNSRDKNVFKKEKKNRIHMKEEKNSFLLCSSIDFVIRHCRPQFKSKFPDRSSTRPISRSQKQGSDILVKRKQKKWLKLTKSTSYSCQPPFARRLRSIH